MANYQGMMTILSKKELVKDVYEMILEGEAASYVTAPGQFINIKITDSLQPYLRRPMSICDYDESHITIIFRVVGEGTQILSKKEVGDQLDCLTGLGNGFIDLDHQSAVVIGGGLGVPPMYKLTKDLLAKGVKVTAILGFNGQNDVFYKEEFEKLCPTYIATMDGSLGMKGTVVDVLQQQRFDMDVYYVDHISFLMDWKIIFQTVMTVLKRDGISSETAATMEMFTGTAENVDSSKKKSNR